MEVDGHNIGELINKSNRLILKKNKPNLIIANTVKGKGVSFMENKFESHYQVLSKKDYNQSIEQLSKGFSKSIWDLFLLRN